MSETLPECAVAGCDDGADHRWFVHTSDGRHLPACDGHGGLVVQDCNLRYQSPSDINSKRGMSDAECAALLTTSIADLAADLKKAEARIAEVTRYAADVETQRSYAWSQHDEARAEVERMRAVYEAAFKWYRQMEWSSSRVLGEIFTCELTLYNTVNAAVRDDAALSTKSEAGE